MIAEGYALLLHLPFANGTICDYPRPFLVIGTSSTELELLNVSSIQGKEWKLMFSSNKKIVRYNPPFDRPSFVKMDELYIISNFKELNKKILNGQPLDSEEFDNIVDSFMKYKANHEIINVRYDESKVRQYNSI